MEEKLTTENNHRETLKRFIDTVATVFENKKIPENVNLESLTTTCPKFIWTADRINQSFAAILPELCDRYINIRFFQNSSQPLIY